ncbi:MAG TPA: hypothetical protein VHG91_13530 [Longimicrobium sp.]|nr:hypothetical protein [Longimicrobium sp.]
MTRTRTALLAAAALVAAACADQGQPTSPDAAPAAAARQEGGKIDLASLSRTVPGFGGVYLENGVPVVFLTNPADRAHAERALAGYLGANGLKAAQVKVRKGDFTFAQLERFHRGVVDVLGEPGVVFTDVDEANNRVTIGVEHAAAGAKARSLAALAGVPAGAVRIQPAEPIHFAATLRDIVSPVQAGLQIHFGNYVCTIGFNATHSGGASFVTNSHCTNNQGGTEGTLYYQPASNLAPVPIATEAADPVYVKNIAGCPRGKRCRYSDSSRALYAAGVVNTVGMIARTTSRGTASGPLTIDAANPFLTITGEDASQVVGQQVNKIGRTTGWTYGNVTNTCVNTGVSGTSVALLCQTFVAGGVGGGDSGSPVFTWGGGSTVTLKGILWGGNSTNTTFIYSPINQVEQELGALPL